MDHKDGRECRDTGRRSLLTQTLAKDGTEASSTQTGSTHGLSRILAAVGTGAAAPTQTTAGTLHVEDGTEREALVAASVSLPGGVNHGLGVGVRVNDRRHLGGHDDGRGLRHAGSRTDGRDDSTRAIRATREWTSDTGRGAIEARAGRVGRAGSSCLRAIRVHRDTSHTLHVLAAQVAGHDDRRSREHALVVRQRIGRHGSTGNSQRRGDERGVNT